MLPCVMSVSGADRREPPRTFRTAPSCRARLEPEVVQLKTSRNEPLMLLETRENNRSLRQLPLLNVNCFLIKCRQNQMMSEEFLPCATLEIVQQRQEAHTFWGAFLGFSCPLQPYTGTHRPFLAHQIPYLQHSYNYKNAAY